MGLLNDFVRCGLLSERVVENPVDTKELPKVSDEEGQVTHSASDKEKKADKPAKKADDKSALDALKVVHMGMCAARDQMNAVLDMINGEELKSGLSEKAQQISDICDEINGMIGGESGSDDGASSEDGDAPKRVPDKGGSGGGGSSGWKSLGGAKPSAAPSPAPAASAPTGGEAPPKGGEG